MTLALGMPAIRRDPSAAPSTEGRPDVPGLVHRFGRVARDLRVSITEKCSLRCTYCMPAEGLPAIPRDDLLTAPEIARLVGIGWRSLGVKEVRFTGGEPLARGGPGGIVRVGPGGAPGIPLAVAAQRNGAGCP